MKKRTLEQRFARQVTRGMWILPWRRREAQREILEHLEDLAEERGVVEWTQESLEREFGQRKRLRKLYKKGGVPLWGKFLKFGVGCVAFVLLLLISVDLGILWFYTVEPGYIELLRSSDPYANRMLQGKVPIPQVNVQWVEEGDDRSKELLSAITKCQSIVSQQYKRIEEARKSFEEKRRKEWIAEGITGATKARMIEDCKKKFYEFMFPDGLDGMGDINLPKGMGMGALPDEMAEEMLIYETADPKFVDPFMPKDDFDRLLQLWTSVKGADRIRIPREMATEKDVEELNTFLENKEKEQKQRLSVNVEPGWLGLMMAFHTLGADMDLMDSIQRAKDATASRPYCEDYTTIMQILVGNLNNGAADNYGGLRIDGVDSLSDAQVAEILEASTRWARLLLEAIRPNPEPTIDYLCLVGSINMAFEAMKNRVDSLDDLPTYAGVMRELSQVEMANAAKSLENLPKFDRDRRIPFVWRQWAFGLSRLNLFKAQCSLMQWFCKKESDAYYRYEVLKNYIGTMIIAFSSPNLHNMVIRSKVAMSQSALSESALRFQEWFDDPNRSAQFDLNAHSIEDPFQPGGPKFIESASAYEFQCAGPDGTFGGAIYDTSNGTTSAGDLIWRISK